MRRRGVGAAANEAVDSLSNFIFAVWVARQLHAPEFGAFAVSFSIVQIGIGISQGVSTMPMMVRYANSSWRASRRLAGEVLGATLVVSLVAAFCFLGVAGFSQGHPLASCSLAFAAVVPGLLLQDSCVLLFYNRKQVNHALLNNVLWLVLQIPLFVVLPWAFGSHHAWVYILAWGLAAYLATAISLLQLRVIPRVDQFSGWFRRRRASILDLSVESVVNRLSAQSATWALAGEAGLRTTAGVRAGQIPLGIPRIFIVGLAPMGLAEGTRLFAKRPSALRGFVRVWSVGNTLVCWLLGVGLILMPTSLGRAMAGDSWRYAHPLLVWVVLIAVGNAILVPAQTGLKCLGVTRISAVVRTITAPLATIGAVLGGLLGGDTPAVIGMAVGSLLSGVVAHVVFEREFSRRTTSEPDAPVPVAAPEPMPEPAPAPVQKPVPATVPETVPGR